jgi:hypothetical protein
VIRWLASLALPGRGEGPGCSHGYSLLTAHNGTLSSWQAQNSAQVSNVVNRGITKNLVSKAPARQGSYWTQQYAQSYYA